MTTAEAMAGLRDESNEQVEARMRLREAATAAEMQIEDRDRAESAAVGVPYEVWTKLDRRQRADIMHFNAKQSERTSERVMATLDADATRDLDLSTITTQDQFEDLGRRLITFADQKSHVLMCDPPIEAVVDGVPGLYHPNVSRIPRKMREIKAAQGFTLSPRYPFLPEPKLPCRITELSGGFVGRVCPYKGRDEKEVLDHMEDRHPNEYKRWREQQERDQQDTQLALLREQVEELRAARKDRESREVA